jgi:transcriptional regulator with XRE-family HTH domain
MEQLSNLGRSLRQRRKEIALTQAELAARSGIPLRTYIRVEAGDQGVKIGTYALAAQALGLELALTGRARPTLDQLDQVYGDN